MATVSILNVSVRNNPAPFNAPYEFEITFECLEPLQKDLEWKLTYVGSATRWVTAQLSLSLSHTDSPLTDVAQLRTRPRARQPSRRSHPRWSQQVRLRSRCTQDRPHPRHRHPRCDCHPAELLL